MAEDDNPGGGGGKGLKGNIKLPGIGPVKKSVVLVVGGAGAAFVLWRYYQSSQASAEAVPGDSDGDGFADAGTLPSVSGAVSDDNSYGLPDTSSGSSTDTYGFSGTTNSQWTQYAATQLSAASDKWSYGDVLDALGAFLANRPLTTLQQQIVQAAIAAAGQPPEGTHPVIPGGDTPITVAPTGVKVDSTTTTSAHLVWNPVAGASGYRIYRSGNNAVVGVGSSNAGTVVGLKPNTVYTFQVAAFTASQQVGPKSSGVQGKTKAVTLAKVGGVKVSSVTKTTAKVSWSKVSGADYYRIYVNGVAHGAADGGLSSYTIQGLKANTSYKVKVAADTTNQSPGPASGEVSFKTKK